MAQAKYKKWLEKDNLILVQAWARDGLSNEQIAHNMGISRTTLFEWEKKYPDISNALKKGKEVVDFEVENTLLKKALGGYVVEEQTIEQINTRGEISTRKIRNKRYLPPDTASIIFWLKNRKPNVWMDRKAQEIELKKDNQLENYFNLLDKEILKDE